MPANEHSNKKNEHTRKIAAERAMMDVTGLSRSQLRRSFLGDVLRDFNATVQNRKAQEPQEPRKTAEIKTESQTLGSTNIPPPSKTPPVPPQQQQVNTTIPMDIYINGVRTQINVVYMP